MLDLSFWSLALVFMLLGFLGWNPRAHNLGCVHKLNYAHASLFVCVHDLPRNPNPNFSDSVSHFLAWYAFVLVPLYIYLCFWVSVSHVCLFVFFSHVKLGFIFCFLVFIPWTCVHMFMHECHRCWVAAR